MASSDGSTVLVSTIVMMILVALIAFVFLLLVFAMCQWRRVHLNKKIKRLIDKEQNDNLKTTKKHLGKMYELCEEKWEERATIQPIPEPKRIPAGWIFNEEGKPIHIRNEIIEIHRSIPLLLYSYYNNSKAAVPKSGQQLYCFL